MNPCPPIDFTGGFNQFYAAVYNLTNNMTIENVFGAPFGERPGHASACQCLFMPGLCLAPYRQTGPLCLPHVPGIRIA